MPMRHKNHEPPTMIRVIQTLLLAALLCGSTSADSATASSVLARVREASGGAAWSPVGEIFSEGQEAAVGLTAAWRLREDLRNGRFAQTSNFAVFRTADV